MVASQHFPRVAGETGSIGRAQADAQDLGGEGHGTDQVDPLADQVVAQLDLEQVVLDLLDPVLDPTQQALVGPREPGQHYRILAVALPVVLIDRTNLAVVGDQHAMAKTRKEAADPRALHADLHHDERAGVLLRQAGHRFPRVDDGGFIEDLPICSKHSNRVLLVTEFDPKGSSG